MSSENDSESLIDEKVKAFAMRSIIETPKGIIAHCTIFERKEDEKPKPDQDKEQASQTN